MVKTVVKPIWGRSKRCQQIENPTPHKFFFCRYYTIHQHNSQAPSLNTQNLHRSSQRKRPAKKVDFIFEKVLDFLSLLWYVVVLTEKEAKPMKNMINELWHGNIVPQEDSRTNSPQMKELLGYMARHHEDLEKTFTDEQKEIFEKFHDCWNEYMSLAEAAIFEYAFKLGMQIAIETLIE